MKILVIGSGGREHAICATLQRTSGTRLQLFCAPGNAGIAQSAESIPIKVDDRNALLSFAESQQIDLTIVGPAVPLAAGLVDLFADRGADSRTGSEAAHSSPARPSPKPSWIGIQSNRALSRSDFFDEAEAG
jgi:phosphoribosylamine-glycine ligase